MFTGIIQDLGKIEIKRPKGDSLRFIVKAVSKKFLKGVKNGDSVSINGACMTVEKTDKKKFEFTTINESLKKTNLGLLKEKSIVNLEKAMTLNSKLDGHLVQGHIDTTGIVEKIILKKDSYEFYIAFPVNFRDNIISVGSIAINGVSLTIAEISKETSESITIKVAIIPHTFKVTNFKNLKQNDIVNIEFDMMGKYVMRIVS